MHLVCKCVHGVPSVLGVGAGRVGQAVKTAARLSPRHAVSQPVQSGPRLRLLETGVADTELNCGAIESYFPMF